MKVIQVFKLYRQKALSPQAVVNFVLVAITIFVTIQGSDSFSHPQPSLIRRVDAFSTLYGHFYRTFAGRGSADTTEGEFYYTAPGKMYIEVRYPLRQIMVIAANVTTIYYPVQKQAFRLESANPVMLPLVPGLMAAIRPDYGLSDLGLSIQNQEMRGDTVLSTWSHPKARHKIGYFKIAEVKDRLAYTLYVSPDSLNRNKTNFSGYVAVAGIFFPTQIASVVHSPKERAIELVTLSGLKVNPEIPPEIANFKIPEGVTVTKRKW